MPNASMIRPVIKCLLGRTHRQLNHTRGAQPILNNRVDGVAVGHVNRPPAVFVAVCFERFDGASYFRKKLALFCRIGKVGIGTEEKGGYPATKSSRMTPPQLLPSRVLRPGRTLKFRFVQAVPVSPPPVQSTLMPEAAMM